MGGNRVRYVGEVALVVEAPVKRMPKGMLAAGEGGTSFVSSFYRLPTLGDSLVEVGDISCVFESQQEHLSKVFETRREF
jgi:hypothetical protein